MNLTSAEWYARRLRSMGPREVLWRAEDAIWQRTWAREQVVEWGGVLGRPPGVVDHPEFRPVVPPNGWSAVPPLVSEAVLASADRLLAGEWEVLGVPRTDIVDPDWFHDEVTGVRAPSRTLGFRINHRDEAHVGNVKALWEVSRHHHLTLLAAAWWVTGDERYAKTIDAQLRSWWERNPFLSGVHWTSGIEIGIRLISWTWIRRLLDDWAGAENLFERNDRALWQIWWHQRFLARFRSRGSSANNHVVAEAAGLLVASCAFPWYAESADWQRKSRDLLEEELDRNTFPSGINRELATDYHRFVTELGLVAAVEAEAARLPLSQETRALLGRSLDAAAALLDVAGQPPRQGDGDDGRALVVDPPDTQPWPQLLGIAEAVLGGAEWWPESSASVESVVLGALAARPSTTQHLPSRPDRFEDAGIGILRTPVGETPELWCRLDGGPHGFLSIAAHAHADALSLEFRCDGVQLLVDPGTYCYHGEPEWRNYFRSTLGHNTVEVGGFDQSISGGPFLWTQHAPTRVIEAQPGAPGSLSWRAEHLGYTRLRVPVVHQRGVQLEPAERRLTVEDRVLAEDSTGVRLAWHLGPAVTVDLDGALATLRWTQAGRPHRAVLSLPGSLRWTTHRAQTDPVLGWYSPSFGVRVPSTTLIGSGEVDVATSLVTVLAVAAE